jgi:hypothetical protein
MTQKLPLCFEVYIKGDAHSLPRINSSVLAYEMLLSSLVQVCEQFTFSLRYLYDPSVNQKLRSFILINPSSQLDSHEILKNIEELLRGSLSRFYSLTHQPEVFKQLDWVRSIGELFKHGEFVEQPEFIGYLPYLFSTELIDYEFSILELLEAARCEKLVLEFSLETYDSPREKACWKNAIDDLVSRLSSCTSKSNSVKHALELYRNYQSNYTENQLFKYSLKALGCNGIDTVAILQTFLGLLGKANPRQKISSILTYSPNDSSFKGSLEATQNIQIFQNIKWHGWEKPIGKSLEKKFIKETVKSGGLLSSFDDGSLTFPILPPNLGQLNPSQKTNHSLPALNESTLAPNSSDLVLGGNTSLSRIFEVQIPKVEHLKPLHHITTFQEVVGFFQVFSPTASVQQNNFPVPSAKEMFEKYQDLITEDTYIVGLDDNENPIISSWAEIPHRLIAGVSGAGKTNFLNWIIFQFLYVNPKRKVYIADFGGVDFQYLSKLELNVEIVDTLEDCQDLVKKIHREEYERRRDLMREHVVTDLKLLQEEGVDIDRTLWIIDEAADIAYASSKLRGDIETKLQEYARKGRKFGIHMLYCTQRPTTEVVTKQVTDQCEEKTVFRVSPDASQRILDDPIAGEIPKDARGRAVLDGYAGRRFVNVPKIEKPEGSKIPIADTLWRYLVSR